MKDTYVNQTVGQMLSYYAEQRQALRAKVAVFNFPTMDQVRSALGFKTASAR